MKLKLLILEDDKELLDEMKQYFETIYDVYTAESLAFAREILETVSPDAAVLDLILPDGNGKELLSNHELGCPTIILTTMDGEDDHMEGLDVGAKDYLVKPISMRILAKHIAVRLAPIAESILVSGKLTIDTSRRIVHYGETPVQLTSTEFNILVFLYENSDSFHTAETIYSAVYGEPFLKSTTIKMHLCNLRYKLADIAPNENYIQTQYGKGYRFRKEAV